MGIAVEGINVRRVRPDELETLIHALTLFMGGDEFFRWIFPNPAIYRKAFPHFMRSICLDSIEHEFAWVAENFSAVAVMLPPDAESEGNADASHWIPHVDPQVLADLSRLSPRIQELRPGRPAVNLAVVGADVTQRRDILRTALLCACEEDVRARLGPEFGTYWQVTSPILAKMNKRWGAEYLGEVQEGESPTVMAFYRPPTNVRPS